MDMTNESRTPQDLQCPLCQKEFTQEVPHKRHVSYCRKAHQRPRIRSQACQACNASKLKCNFQQPCGRCAKKGISCEYLRRNARTPGSATTSPAEDTRQESESAPQLDPWPSLGTDLIQDGLLDLSGVPSLPLAEEASVPNLDSTFLALGNESPDYFSGASSSSGSETLVPTKEYNESSIPAQVQVRLGALTYLPAKNPMAYRSSRLLLQAIRAYPTMMLRRETFPPFIHPKSIGQATSKLPEAIANCMSIAVLFASRENPGTRAYLWDAIRDESKRLLNKKTWDAQGELVAGVQAHIIYIIMRFIGGDGGPLDLDLQLVMTHKILCMQSRNWWSSVTCRRDRTDAPATWEAWIYEQSVVRTSLMFFLLTRILSVYTADNCPVVDRYREMLLCCGKDVWEADTRMSWMTEYTADVSYEQGGLTTIGDLIEAQNMADMPGYGEKLDSWHARADKFGLLLNIASMIEP